MRPAATHDFVKPQTSTGGTQAALAHPISSVCPRTGFVDVFDSDDAARPKPRPSTTTDPAHEKAIPYVIRDEEEKASSGR